MTAVLSGIVLLAFAACLFVRAAALRRRGVRAFVQGPFEKSEIGLPVFVIILIYAALAKPLGLPMWGVIVRPFWTNAVPGWIGLVLCVLALVLFLLTLVSFGDSLRVGIDEKAPAKLMTGGMFAVSRNPLYLCFFLLLIGLVLIYRNLLMAAAAVFFAAMIHRQILKEEAFLKKHYGGEYEDYCRKVRRYL